VDLELSLLVPASQCGALIGKEGAKIKDMRYFIVYYSV
jgi:hypothetical protein